MTQRKYKKIIKLMEKALELMREDLPDFKTEAYSNIKCKLMSIIKTLIENENWWLRNERK